MTEHCGAVRTTVLSGAEGERSQDGADWAEVEIQAGRPEAKPGDPLSKAELETGRPEVNPRCMA